jgi:uracil DNA glycosylase
MLEIGEDDERMIVSRACGFSFSSPLGMLPVSLRTVFTEILREYPQPMVEQGGRRAPRPAKGADYSGDLSYLVADGVFLLNTFLTLPFNGKKGVSGIHTSWTSFATQVLNFIRRTCPNAVYLALGKKAVDLMKSSGINDAIECDHPANRTAGRNPFKGSDIFLKADEILAKRGIRKVDWVPMKSAIDRKYYDDSITMSRPLVAQPIASAPPPPLPSIIGMSIDIPSEDSDDVDEGELGG